MIFFFAFPNNVPLIETGKLEEVVREKSPYHILKAQNPLPLMAMGVLFELRAAEMSFWYLISVRIAITTRFGNKFETSKKILQLLQGNYSEPVEAASDGCR